MTEISDVLRDNAGINWNISVNTSGEIVIQTEDTTASSDWTDATYSTDTWTDVTY